MDPIHLLEAAGSRGLEAAQAPAKCLSAKVTGPWVWLETDLLLWSAQCGGCQAHSSGCPSGITSKEQGDV